MKIRSLLFMLVTALCLCACSDDDDTTSITSSVPVDFTIVNLSTSETINGSGKAMNVVNGDTLEITYRPTVGVSGKITVTVSELRQINDSLYVVKNMSEGQHSIQYAVVSDNAAENTSSPVSVTLDVSKEKHQFTDTNAGTFSFRIRNVTYDESDSLIIKAFSGDTIEVVFTPNQQYKNHHFTLSCQDIESNSTGMSDSEIRRRGLYIKLNDSLYTVRPYVGKYKFDVIAKYGDETTTKKTSYSATSSFTVVNSGYVTVPYVLQVSEDLLQFVTPEITYNDSEGNMHTFTLGYDDMTHSDSVTTSYMHNGVEEFYTYLPYAKYTFNLDYHTLPATTEVNVRYIPKENISITRDNYKFEHGIDRGESVTGLLYTDKGIRVIMQSYFGFSFTIEKGFDGSKKETEQDIRQYIGKLSTTPDVKKWSIDENGSIEEIK